MPARVPKEHSETAWLTTRGIEFMEAQGVLLSAVELDPGARNVLNVREALRDALEAMAPATWVKSERELEELARQEAEQQQAAQMMQGGLAGAEVAEKLGSAAKDFSEVGGGQAPF